ncbi:uncharacterized protein [Procambarus clarkii]|uniref:uncharacterized protein n=1 Tax=Procambarus clarkii TaxID=6728 RepID=UPI003742E7B5
MKLPEEVNLLISSAEASPRSSTPTVALSEVEELVETVIVLHKDPRTHELGLRVVGGVDTYLGCVVVEEVTEGGEAWVDGRLQRGDIILQVNNTSFMHSTQEEAVKVLRCCSSPVRLLVIREDPEQLFTTTKEPTIFITMELYKSSVAERIGLSLMERRDRKGIFVTLVEAGSLAAGYGGIMQGDKLLAVNQTSVASLSLQRVVSILRSLEGRVVVVVGRVPELAGAIQRWACSQLHTSTPTPRPTIHSWLHSTLHKQRECGAGSMEDAGYGSSTLLAGRMLLDDHTTAVCAAPRFPLPLTLIRILRSLHGRSTPFTRTVLQVPSTQMALHSTNSVHQGLSPHSDGQGPTTHSDLQGLSTRSVRQTPSTYSVLQDPSTHSVYPGPSTHAALQGSSTHAALQGPSTHAALQGSSTHIALQGSSTHTVLQGSSTSFTHVKVLQGPSTHRALDQGPSTHRVLDQAPSTHRALDQAPSTHRALDQAPSTHRALDQAPSTHRVLDQAPSTHRALDQAPSTHRALDQAPSTHRVLDQASSTPRATRSSLRAPAHVYNTAVICAESVTCGSHKPFLTGIKITSF